VGCDLLLMEQVLKLLLLLLLIQLCAGVWRQCCQQLGWQRSQ
jgi:hypothetical protein